MKADHLRNFNSLALTKFGKYKKKKITNLFKIIFLSVCSYGCTEHHSTAVNRQLWGTMLILRPCPGHCGFAPLHVVSKLDHKDTARRSHRRYTSSQNHNSTLLSSLSNSIWRHKRNLLFLRNVARCSLLVASACYLLNQTYI